MAETISTGWQLFEDEDGLKYHRAILENYIVFLRSEPPLGQKQKGKKQKQFVSAANVG